MFNVSLKFIGGHTLDDVFSHCPNSPPNHSIPCLLSLMAYMVQQQLRGVSIRARGRIRGRISSSVSVPQNALSQKSTESYTTGEGSVHRPAIRCLIATMFRIHGFQTVASLFLKQYFSDWLKNAITQRDEMSNANKNLKRRLQKAEGEIQIVRIEKTAMAEKIKAM